MCGLTGRRLAILAVSLLLLVTAACAVVAASHKASAPSDAVGGAPSANAVAPPLEAPTGFEPYIYRATGERADPVNIIFLHTDGTTAAAASERVLGWRMVVASGMNFKQKSGGTRPTSRQLAADIGPGSRFHMRIQAVPLTDTQTYVLASVHRDETVACGHVGRGFDETRDLVARTFAEAGYRVAYVDIGNTNSGLHCDGSRVPGDGRAVLIDLSHFPRVDLSLRGRVPGAY
jgi:hypothetical protein